MNNASLDELLARGPVVVRFNRGTWCPFCDLELKATSDGSWDLPFPSTFVIGRDGRVAWSAVEANWTVRPEPADVAAVTNAVRAAA